MTHDPMKQREYRRAYLERIAADPERAKARRERITEARVRRRERRAAKRNDAVQSKSTSPAAE